MNLTSKKTSLALAILVSAAFLAGCSKKPVRPEPGETVMGEQGGGASALNPQDVPQTEGNSGLEQRDNFDANGQLRGAIDSVYFSFAQYNVKKSEQSKVQAAKDYLDKHPQYRLLLEGHCDWRGTAEYNLGLGDRRANEVKKYLVTLGVSADKLDTLSKGSEDATKNGDQGTMSKDRRVDFVVVQPGGASADQGAASGPAAGGAAGAPAPAGPSN